MKPSIDGIVFPLFDLYPKGFGFFSNQLVIDIFIITRRIEPRDAIFKVFQGNPLISLDANLPEVEGDLGILSTGYFNLTNHQC